MAKESAGKIPRCRLIKNRTTNVVGFTCDPGGLGQWFADQILFVQLANRRAVAAAAFQTNLNRVADGAPPTEDGEDSGQAHVCFFVHGDNVDWNALGRQPTKTDRDNLRLWSVRSSFRQTSSVVIHCQNFETLAILNLLCKVRH